MAKKYSCKRSLLASVLILCLCLTSFVGTTFAWFTDSVTSANNIIKTGTLDVKLEYSVLEDGVWTDYAEVTKDTDVFGYNNWEPGYVAVARFRITNAGTLALKYVLSADIYSETPGKNVDGEEFLLSDSLYTKVVDPSATREQILAYTDGVKFNSDLVVNGSDLLPADDKDDTAAEHVVETALAIWMPTTTGNEANYREVQPSITFGINLIATQTANEEDSFGPDYDADAPIDWTPVANEDQLAAALAKGAENIVLTDDILVTRAYDVTYDANIDGKGHTLARPATALYSAEAAELYTGNVFNVKSGATLALENIVVDGGAVWTGEIDPCLGRGTVNAGATSTGALVATEANAHIVLGEGAILQNIDGANAVNLGTRIGATLTIDGGEIINNHSAAGAIWGGGAITLNSGKINGNHGGIGGAIRVVTNVGTVLTMNGGEMNHNKSDGVGGAIWAGSSASNNVYVLNGGEMAYNYSATTGGAIYAGYYETVKIGGNFKMHDNSCADSIGGGIRFHDHASLVMTGGEVYDNYANGQVSNFFLNNNSASITGGYINGDLAYSGGLGLTVGVVDIDGVIKYSLATNHNTAYLAEEFGTFKFSVNEGASNFASFNFKPAAGYVYTEGDEDKLVCMNEGYSTYWDAASGTFRLMAD